MKTILLTLYMLSASIFDIKTKKIPLWFILIFSLFLLAYSYIFTDETLHILSFIPGIVMLLISIITSHSLGLGDSLFALSLGILLSFYDLICILLFAMFYVCIAGLFLFIINKDKRQSLPFIPFIFLSFLITNYF